MLQRFQSRRQVSRKLNRQILRGSLYACEALEKRVLLSLVVPVLHSLPGAAKTLYLDFTGNPAFEWNGQKAHGPGSVNAPIPAFSMDADVNNFSALELTTIQNIWAIAAEKFSPFNLDVTTEDPGNRTQGTTLLDIIGGSNSDWSGTGSGVSVLGSFNNPNLAGSLAVFAWSGDLPWSTNIPFATSFLGGYVIPHEAGHSFSLAHQRSGTNPITEYYGGDSTRSPIMGGSGNVTGNNPAIRGIWWRTNMDGLQNSPDPVQDDLSILTSPGNGFGYRPFDHYYSNPFSITTLTPDSNGQLSTGTGVIARTTDVAPFQFQAIGPTGSFTINASVNGGMLKPFLNLVDASTMSNVSSTTVESATSANLTTNSLSPGHYYYIEARSAGNYGDIGQYTITGVLQNFAYLSGSTIHIIGFGDNANNITISRNSSTYTVTDSIFGGTATQTFAASLVGDINVALGGGDDTLNFGAGAFTSMVTATIAMGGGNNALIVDDSANTAVTSYELFSNQIDRQGFSFLGLAQFDSSVKSVKLYTGGQLGDVVSVYSTTVPTTIQNQNDTTINIGNFSRTVGIQGALTIINPIGGTSVNINDSADPTGKNVIFSDHGIFGLCANINWTTADVNGVTVSGGQGGNSFTVTGTDPVVGGAQNILYAGTSSDYVDIEQTTRPLTVNTQTGADTVYVGAAGNLDSIQGALLTVNGNSSSTLTLQDYLNPYYIVPTVDTFTNTTFTRDGVSLVVVNLVGVQFVQHIATIVNSGFGNVVLNTGALINTVNVESDASPITVNTQSGGNIYVALSQNAENLDNVPALVTVHGNGTDAVLVEDQNNASLVVTQNFLTATSLTRIGATYIFPQGIPIFVVHPASVSYSGVGSVTFDAGTLTNTYYVHGTTPTTAYVINGGAGSDLLDLGQGNLTNVVSDTFVNRGGITFNPGGGADELLLDDSNSSAPLSYLINPGTIDIANHLHVAFGNNLALVLNAGTGADTETISGTGFGVPLTINESSGNATGLITGSNVNSPIAINAGSGTDNFTVGATGGTLFLFTAQVTITGQTGNASLTVNDRADKNFTVSSTKVVEKFGNFDGYAVNYAHLANLTVNVGAGGSGNTMTVSSTAPGTALFVNEAAGNNSVIIGNAANTQAILGDVTIGNVLGQTALLVDDSADTTGRTVTLTKSAITGLAPAIIHYIENGSTTTGIRPLTLKTGSGNDMLIVDFSNGNPLAASAASFDGGPGVNTLAVIGTTASDTLAANSTSFTFTGGIFGTVPITATHIQSLQFHGGSGGNDSINLTGGSYTIDADTPTGTPNVSVIVGPTAIANFATDQHLANLTINGGVANLSTARHSMVVNGLAISNNGLLDIANSFLYLNNTATSFVTVKSYLDAAYNLFGASNPNKPLAGDYAGLSGITSSVAKASYANDLVVGIGYYDGALQNPTNPDSVGQIYGPDSNSGHGTGIPLNQILIRPTLTGDFNGDGVVNSYDVSLFNSYGLFNNGPTPLGWQVGDLNGDSLVNVKDVTVFNSVGNFNQPPFPVPAVTTAVAKVLAQSVAGTGTVAAAVSVSPKSHQVRHHSVRKAGHGKVAARIARVIGALRRV